MLNPDFDMARRFLAQNPPPGEVLHVGLVGAHDYGFPSHDSDLDLKGMHIAPTEVLLGLDAPPETHDVLTDFEGVEHDLTTHEVGKALALMLRGNGNVLERLATPLQVVQTDDLAALRQLMVHALSQRVHGHYRGYFGGMCREHHNRPRAKSLLYAYRVALTGIHLLRSGEVRGDVRANADEYGIEGLGELIAIKRQAEKGPLPEAIDTFHRARWPELERGLEEALAASALPVEPPGRAAIDAWLVDRRRRAFGG